MKKKSILKSLFSYRVIDEHLKLRILGMRMNFRLNAKLKFPHVDKIGVSNTEKTSGRLICSLTSIPPRIEKVDKVISCLLSQTLKPDMLILWLASDEFPEGEKALPPQLLRLKEFGLTIKFCKNYKSYKKLVPALIEYPDDYVLTFDDDIFYDENVVKNLWASSQKHPNCACCYRTGRIELIDDKISPISNNILIWNHPNDATYKNVIMSGTGTLFPPHSLHEDMKNEEIFMKLMPSNDEIFFWGMCVRNKTKIVNTMGFNYKCLMLREQQKVALSKINKKGSNTGIDGASALQLLAKTYPEIISIIKSED